MELDEKLKNIYQTVFHKRGKNIIADDIVDSLISRIETLSYFVKRSRANNNLIRETEEQIDSLVDELDEILNNLSEHSLLQKIRNFLPGSNLSKLKLIIPKLLKLTDEIVVEGINSESNNLKVIPEMKYRYSSITELMDKLKSSRLIVTHDLSISLHQRTIPIKWCQEPSKVSFILTRDKFHYLPTNLTTRISKEHAKITGFVRNGLTIFEITSLSKNRIYYLGNKLKHPDGEELRTKIEKNIPYQFYNGDEFGLLTEKKNKTNKEKMLISFLLIIF